MYENDKDVKRDPEAIKRMKWKTEIYHNYPNGDSDVFNTKPITCTNIVHNGIHIILEIYSISEAVFQRNGNARNVRASDYRKRGQRRSLFFYPHPDWKHYNNMLPDDMKITDSNCVYMFDTEFEEHMDRKKLCTNTALKGLYGETLHEQYPTAVSIMDNMVKYVPYYVRGDYINDMYGETDAAYI